MLYRVVMTSVLLSFLPKEALAEKNPSFKPKGPGMAAVLAGGLGTLFGLGVGLTFFSEIPCIGPYLMFLSFFHFSEYIWVAIYHPDTLSADCKFTFSFDLDLEYLKVMCPLYIAFLINHSKEYTIAITGSVIEFLVEFWLFPSLKYLWPFTWLGNSFLHIMFHHC